MRVLQGKPGALGQDADAERDGSPAVESSYDQGYQQASLWKDAADEAGAGSAKEDGGVNMDRTAVIDTQSGRLISGAAAPMKRNLDLYLKDRPYMQVFDTIGSGGGASSGKKRAQGADAEMLDASAGIKSRDLDGNDAHGGMEKRRNQDQSGTSSKKRFKPAAGPPMEAMDHEVLSALETWSDAMQEASDMLDKEACSSVLEELLALHERVQTKQNVGDTASLRALITSQFPKTCLDILRSLGDFDTMRLTECVTAALNIDQQMSDGKNLGDEELSALGREKILELDKLGQRNDQLVKEFEAVRKEEEEAISHHTEELQKTRSSIQQLRAEEEKLRKELEEVDSEAAAHLAVLEKFAATSTGNPGQAKDVGSSADTAELSNSIWKSDEIQKEMSELLRTRGSVDRARDGVHAAQSHLTLMHYVCEFSSEVRRCMETYCNDELLGALQRELEALQQDKAKLDHIAEQLKSIREESHAGGSGVEAGRPGLARTGSLRDKYRRFYTERIQDMRSKHFKARHTASGLLSYFAAEAAPQRAGEDPKSAPQQAGEGEGSTEAAKVVQLALDIISLVDNLQKIANENCSPDEPIHEVLPEKAASTLALFSVDKEARMWRSGCITKCVEELGRIAEKPSLNGRLAVKDCDKVAGTDLCGIIDAVQGGVGGSSLNIGEASAAAGCVCQALDEVCKGKSRTVLCLVPYVVLKREAWSAEDGLPKKTVKFPLLSAALLHTRVEHTWVQKIAVIDLVRPTTPMGSSIDAQILQLSPIMDAEGRPEVDAEKMVSRTRGGEAESAEAGEGRAAGELGEFVDRWRRGMEQKVLPGLKQFKPQLILVNIESVLHLEGAKNARTLTAENFRWAGCFLAQVAAALSSGRLVVVWDIAGGSSWMHRSVGDFVKGVLEVQGLKGAAS